MLLRILDSLKRSGRPITRKNYLSLLCGDPNADIGWEGEMMLPP
jgi:hypothetical protein